MEPVSAECSSEELTLGGAQALSHSIGISDSSFSSTPPQSGGASSGGIVPTKSYRPRAGGIALAVLVLLVLTAGYIAITALKARRSLEMARVDVSAARRAIVAGDSRGAERDLRTARSAASNARSLTSGPLWALGARVPVVGRPLATIRVISAVAESLSVRALPDVAATAEDLSPQRLRLPGGGFQLAPLTAASGSLAAADAQVRTAESRIARSAERTWLAPVDHGRAELLQLLLQLRSMLDQASAAADLMPRMLGSQAARSYLVVFQSNAESRGLDGIAGGFAVMQVKDGQPKFVRFGSDLDLDASVNVDLGSEFAAHYGALGAEASVASADLSPNMPYAAQIWRAMWHKRSGQWVDGVITMDPQALGYLLAVTGPARLDDGSLVTSSNVVQMTESDVYARYPSIFDRKRFFVRVAEAAARQVLDGSGGNARQLATALGRAIGERRFLIWSARADEERKLAQFPLGGLLSSRQGPFTALVINNAAGTKLDYYLDRALQYSATCHSHQRVSRVVASLRNDAPASGLPAYVTLRADNPPARLAIGSNRLLVSIYGTAGARLIDASLDGATASPRVDTELGHPVFSFDVELRPGQERRVSVSLSEPISRGPLESLVQPLVRPLSFDAPQALCGSH